MSSREVPLKRYSPPSALLSPISYASLAVPSNIPWPLSGVARTIISAWVITLPAAAVCAALFYWPVNAIF